VRSYSTRERALAMLAPRTMREISGLTRFSQYAVRGILQLSREYTPAEIARMYRAEGEPMTARRIRQVVSLSAPRTQKEVGRMLGVTDRTVRRWKNEEVLQPMRRHARKLAELSRHERERIYRETRLVASQGKTKYRLPRDLPPLPASRRLLKERDVQGRETGRYKPTDWLWFDVKRLRASEIVDLLLAFQRQGNYMFQVLFRLPANAAPRGGTDPAITSFARNEMTGTEQLRLHDAESLQNFLEDIPYKKLYVSIHPIRQKHRG